MSKKNAPKPGEPVSPGASDVANEVVALVTEGTVAPFIFFDEAPNFGCGNGIINCTLATYRHTAMTGGGVSQDLVVVAHLRCSIVSARALRNALDQALLAVAPGPDQVN